MNPPLRLPARIVFPAATALAFAAPNASAQVDTLRTDTVFRIEGISVSAQRPVTTVGGASAIEIDVRSLPLPAAATAAEVLREIAGLHLRTNSRGQAEISVRGSQSRQVAVLYDGVPLTLGYDARTDVSVLPATALQEVSFVRGLSTLLHGPNVLGGVVEMNVAKGRSVPETGSTEASASLDDTGGYSVAAGTTVPFATDGGRGMVMAGAGFRDSPGMPLPGDVTEPIETGDGLRLNTDYRNLDGYLAFRYVADEGPWASLSGASHAGSRGIAAELGAEDPRLWRYPDVRRTIVATSAGTGQQDTPWGRGDLEASVGYDDGVTNVRSYESRDYDVESGFEDGNDQTISVRLLGDHTLGRRGDLRSSLTFANIRHDETVDGEFREFQQKLLSVAAESAWRLLDGPSESLSSLNLTIGGAFDRATTPLTGGLESLPTIGDWGARLGLSALLANGSTMLHAGASRRGRFPSLRESYSEALDRFEPNPDLSPEHLVALEAGVTSRVGSGEIQVVGFRHSLTDAIRRISLGNGKRQRVNSDVIESYGIELFFSQTLGRVHVGGELTLQSVELTDPNTAVNTNPENVPEQMGSAFLRIPLASDFHATLEAEYTGKHFCIDPDSGKDVELDGGSWLNAVLSKAWPLSGSGGARRVETSIAGLNLTDAALYDTCGLPRAGRLLSLQLRFF